MFAQFHKIYPKTKKYMKKQMYHFFWTQCSYNEKPIKIIYQLSNGTSTCHITIKVIQLVQVFFKCRFVGKLYQLANFWQTLYRWCTVVSVTEVENVARGRSPSATIMNTSVWIQVWIQVYEYKYFPMCFPVWMSKLSFLVNRLSHTVHKNSFCLSLASTFTFTGLSTHTQQTTMWHIRKGIKSVEILSTAL